MGNFEFLLKVKDYKDFASACVDAENQMLVSTVSTAIMARRALELAVKWMYKYDMELRLPYKDNLSALVNDDTFKRIVDQDIQRSIRYIIKTGNLAAHNSRKIEKSQAVTSLRNLFEFIQWLEYSYNEHSVDREFDENLVPSIEKLKLRLKPVETEKIVAQVSVEDTPLEIQREEANDQTQTALTEIRQKSEQIHSLPFTIDPYTEKLTREQFINVDLALAGWTIGQNVEEEVKLEGMPNQQGIGYADYVLFGQDGLPLAVVEAKRTSVSPNEGAHQANLYAELLEKQYKRKPFVFITNGFDMWFTDDIGKRRVSGFYTQSDLQRLIDRRQLKSPLQNAYINPDIAGRTYQRSAILNTLNAYANYRREVLLVMATGTGKTRTAISIVDILTRANWAKNILFLADRTALVKQAMRAFNTLLPELTQANLTESRREDNNPSTSRMIFSTYPTIMNAIDNIKDQEDSARFFSVGHFDLIIIDEAHRSIYKKYQAIFDYFDSMILGLTATPREDIDRNTYERFNLENGVPTFAYDLEEAIADGYLVDYRTVEALLRIPSDGIKYDDLSEEEKEHFEEEFADEGITEVAPTAISQWVFNNDTIDKVIHHFMEHGLRDSSGNEIGKTIVFAANQNHANIIKERFDKLYPEKGSQYTQVITHNVNYAQDLIDRFSVKDKLPQVAISVNMLDTGIDIPEIVNLVFFKKVRSKTMFWQMIGRGTRLCPDLFGPGLDKENFYIFDYGGNFEYFRVQTKPDTDRIPKSLTERLFRIKAELIYELQDLKYQQPEYQKFREYLINELIEKINQLDEYNFRVRQHLEFVVKFKKTESWTNITVLNISDLDEHIGPLLYASEEPEIVQRFDLYMQVIQLSVLLGTIDNRMLKNVAGLAKELAKKGNLPQVQAQAETIRQVQTEEFWNNAGVIDLEKVRLALRDLMQLIDPERRKIFYVDFDDQFTKLKIDEDSNIYTYIDLSNYNDKVESYIREQSSNPILCKIYNNEKISQQDLQDLEKVIFKDLGSKEDYKKYYGDKPITILIREINGLDKAAVEKAFAEFMHKYNLNRNQTEFLRVLMQYLEKNGHMDLAQFQKEPFSSIGSISQIFSEDRKQVLDLVAIVKAINEVVQVA
ncbi:MAG: DEAD/DEAH box helicase family protein [Saccharofermentanales bacterium]